MTTATAVEAVRVCAESARLVSTIGTARPEHDAGRERVGEILQLLGEHVAGFDVGHQQDVGLAGDRQT